MPSFETASIQTVNTFSYIYIVQTSITPKSLLDAGLFVVKHLLINPLLCRGTTDALAYSQKPPVIELLMVRQPK